MTIKMVTTLDEDGTFVVPPFLTERYKKFQDLAAKRYGGYVMIYLSTPERSKTTLQNNKFHALNQEIAFEMGWETEDCKTYIKEIAYENFNYPPELDDEGAVVTDPWGKVKGRSVAKVNIDGMNKLIEAAYFLAAREGIHLYEIEHEKSHGVIE